MALSGTVVLVALVTLAALASAALPGAGRAALGGTLYLGLGALVGPRLLGLVEDDTLTALRPALHVTCGWMGLCLGLGRGARPRPPGGAALALVGEWGLAALLLAAALRAGAGAQGRDSALLCALAGALVCASSGPGLLRWARRRLEAKGPLTARLLRLCEGDALGTLLGLALLCALLPPPDAPAPAAVGRAPFTLLSTLLLGPLLGGAFTLLAGRRPARDAAWVLLIGVLLLCAGLATRLALPAICACYLLGLTIARAAAHRDLYAEIAAQTRGPIEALVLLLCGLSLPLRPEDLWLAAAAVAIRAAAKLLAGAVAAPRGLPGARLGGIGLLGFGPVPLAAALQLELLYRPPPGGHGVGEVALLLGAAQLVVGDVLGPPLLLGLLRRAGELPRRGTP